MALQDDFSRISQILESEIKNIVQNSGHNKTGHLLNSIEVSYDSVGLHFSVLDYVKYLDDGRLLKEIKSKIKEVIGQELTKTIKKELTT